MLLSKVMSMPDDMVQLHSEKCI